MTEIENSKRVLLQATFTPFVSISEEGSGNGKPLRKGGFEKLNHVKTIAPKYDEIDYVRNNHEELSNPTNRGNEVSRKEFLKALKAIESVIPVLESPNALHNVASFAEVDASALVNITKNIIKFRQSQVDSAVKVSNSILKAYNDKVRDYHYKMMPKGGIVGGRKPNKLLSLAEDLQGSSASSMEKNEKLKSPANKNLAAASSHIGSSKTPSLSAMVVSPSQEVIPPTSSIPPSEITLSSLMEWANENGFETDEIDKVLNLADKVQLVPEITIAGSFEPTAHGIIDGDLGVVEEFVRRMHTEPVGLLDLEKLNFIPAGIERGELVHSVPLSPGEEVNISHKEWSNTSEEFQRIVTDYMEGFSEEGVAEKSDMAQSTNSQQQHTNGYNLGVTASGGYGPVNITASAAYNASEASSNSEQMSINHSINITRKASSRVTKEHKITFKVASASGTEDQAVRKIKNPFPDKATRLDYYQLIRKWKVDLLRYGVRLTYDITIPEPGSDLLSKIKDIKEITEKLREEFGFKIKLEDIRLDNYDLLCTQNNVPTSSIKPLQDTFDLPAESEEWKKRDDEEYGPWDPIFKSVKLNVDDNNLNIDKNDYTISEIIIDIKYNSLSSATGWKEATFDGTEEKAIIEGDHEYGHWSIDLRGYKNLIGRSGNVELKYSFRGRAFKGIKLFVKYQIKLKSSVFKAWRLEVWNAIRDAAQSKYESEHQKLEKRLTQLMEELGTGDPLSLRKVEREEVMKGVMRWLFGPSFRFWARGTREDLYTKAYKSVHLEMWERVTFQGEVTKFLHQAIEWENMLYILYPYFWSHPSRWDLKKDLEHPDIMHKVFLKSGCARVVLTIRPGFETDFVTFMESGEMKPMPNKTRGYSTIVEEMQNFAKTNYPGVPSANLDQNARPLISPNQQKTWHDMKTIIELLNAYFKGLKRYPSTSEGLEALKTPEGLEALKKHISGKIPEHTIYDQWGNKFHYKSPGLHADYDLVSYGADKKPGGSDEDADITSWAESSLIGTWYEYTPTSALDIAYNEILPNA